MGNRREKKLAANPVIQDNPASQAANYLIATSISIMTSNSPLKDFYLSLGGQGALPLGYDHPFNVEMFPQDAGRDPILRLAQRIDLAESESVNLLTGFRGNGKSTQLLRLKAVLEQRGCRVFLVDMKNYILLAKPLGITDFILSICAALAEEIKKETRLLPLAEGYGERLLNFLKSRIELKELGLEWNGADTTAKLGASLKTDPSFKQQIQQALRGHVSTLIAQAQEFVVGIVQQIRKIEGDDNKKVVLLVDSVEQIRGVGVEAQQVCDSVINLFATHAANLEFRQLHVLYTYPPFLIQNVARNLGGHAVTQWPNIHVRNSQGVPDAGGGWGSCAPSSPSAIPCGKGFSARANWTISPSPVAATCATISAYCAKH